MNRRTFATLATVTLAAPVVLRVPAAIAQDAIPAGAVEATFKRAVDGEKFKVLIGGEESEVRLIGIDAPEPKIDDNTTECFAIESKDFLQQALTDQTVYLESDAEDKDNKDRLWRFAWATISGVPTLLNEYILTQGMATTREEEKNLKYQDRLTSAEQVAQIGLVGLWGTCESGHQSIPRHGSADDPGVWGETLVADGMAVTPDGAYLTYDYNYSTPKGGYVFLIFNAYVENVGSEKKGYNSGRFLAKDLDSDAEHKETFVLLNQPLGNGDLSPTSYVYGEVAIELQETASNLRIKYQVNGAGGESLYWLLTV